MSPGKINNYARIHFTNEDFYVFFCLKKFNLQLNWNRSAKRPESLVIQICIIHKKRFHLKLFIIRFKSNFFKQFQRASRDHAVLLWNSLFEKIIPRENHLKYILYAFPSSRTDLLCSSPRITAGEALSLVTHLVCYRGTWKQNFIFSLVHWETV